MAELRTVSHEISIDAKKDAVWNLLFNQFEKVNDFNPLIDASRHAGGTLGQVGAERICDLDSKTSVREKITNTRGTDGFDIEIVDGNLPMINKMIASLDLEAIGSNETKVYMTLSYRTSPKFMGGIMKSQFVKMITNILVGLKYHLETGGSVAKGDEKKLLKSFKQLKGGTFEPIEELAIA